jgi:hypothetical protein
VFPCTRDVSGWKDSPLAHSPSHKFGQIIGDLVEEVLGDQLAAFARKHGLFLDRKGVRAARPGKKVTWSDEYGNLHDLDFVLERGGSDKHIGTPVAFIETAWRRYTKHSRNKAQEIQGAIMPLAVKHRFAAPFLGVVAAGVYTSGALNQLTSVGFTVLHLPYETIVAAFRATKIDAGFDEETPDAEFEKKIIAWENLTRNQRGRVSRFVVKLNENKITEFLLSLERAVMRRVETVRVVPLHGIASDLPSVEEAIAFLNAYATPPRLEPPLKYEIVIRYSNGDRVEACFLTRDSTLEFLREFLNAHFSPVSE